MRYGIHTLEDYQPSTHGSVPEYYTNLIDRAILAEELGYEGFWLTEHHFHWYGGVHSNPLVALSAIAARTTKLRVGTAVALLPYSHPLRIAEDYALLDNLSNGRVDLGVGRGFYKVEYDGWGVPMSQSRSRFNEHLEVIRRAWTEERFTFSGEHVSFEELELVPKPVQRPHPPIWLAASATPESFVNNGTLGRPLMIVPLLAPAEHMKPLVEMYRDAYVEAGHPGEPQVLAIFMAHISDDDEATLAINMGQAIENFKNVTAQAEGLMKGERDAEQYKYFQAFLENLKWFTFENVQRTKQVLCGTPEHVAEVLDLWRTEVGVTYASIHVGWGGFNEAVVQNTMRRFMNEAVPQIEALEAS